MQIKILTFFLFLSFAYASILDGEVLVLDDDSFSQAITENELLLVDFYAPW
jgi:hypothetical protein